MDRLALAMQEIYTYDKDVDILYISFSPGEKASAAVELNDNVLLRFNLDERRAIGLTLMDYSTMVQSRDFDEQHLPLTGLRALDPDWRELVIDLMTQPPLNRVLKLSAIIPTAPERTPTFSLEIPLVPADRMLMSDDELLRAAQTMLTPEQHERLEELHFKAQSEGLSAEERQEEQALLETYQETVLARAEAAVSLMRRGYDVSNPTNIHR